MFFWNPGGSWIHSLSGQKNGSTRITQPMMGSVAGTSGARRRRAMLDLNSSRRAAPFFTPKVSQAMERGTSQYLLKNPPPAIAW